MLYNQSPDWALAPLPSIIIEIDAEAPPPIVYLEPTPPEFKEVTPIPTKLVWTPAFSHTWELIWPKLVWALEPLFFVFRQTVLLILFIEIRYIRDRKIAIDAKCPGCGWRKEHKFGYAEDYQKILHNCGVCGAVWGENTVYPVNRWKVTQELQKPAEKDSLKFPIN